MELKLIGEEGRDLILLLAVILLLGIIYLLAQHLARRNKQRLRDLTRFRKE